MDDRERFNITAVGDSYSSHVSGQIKTEQVDYIPVTMSVDYDQFKDHMEDYQARVSKAMGIPDRFLNGDMNMSVNEDVTGSISSLLDSYRLMIEKCQDETAWEFEWLLERLRKWPEANWRRVKREKRKFRKAYRAGTIPRHTFSLSLVDETFAKVEEANSAVACVVTSRVKGPCA